MRAVLRKNKILVCFLLLFGLIYGVISLVNHAQFRTYALDLGLYTNSLYDYAHGQFSDGSLILEKGQTFNQLADHFDLYLVLFAPFGYLLKEQTLLWIQLIFILLGGIGVYRYFKDSDVNDLSSVGATLLYFVFFGTFAAVSFDYHSNTVAAALVPWFLLNVRKQKWINASVLLLFLWIGKENMSLWLTFICIGGLFLPQLKRSQRIFFGTSALLSLIVFIAITQMIMPLLTPGGKYLHFHYSILGSDAKEALIYLASNPIQGLRLLFTNHSEDPSGDFVKLELFILLTLSGLPFLLKRPQYLIMLLPILAQKLYHDRIGIWGVNGQYAIEFAPILAIGVFEAIRSLKLSNKKHVIYSVCILAGLSTLRTMDRTVFYTDKARLRIYQAKHYQRPYDISPVMNALNQIPKDVAVSAQSPFTAHLAWRDKCYQFPKVADAQFLLLNKHEVTYPLSQTQFNAKLERLLAEDNWEILFEEKGTYLFKRP